MSRHLRFVPEGGSLVEVTCRTIQGRLLLRPSPQLNSIVLGVLGRAEERHPLEVVAFSVLSSHYHLLLRVEDARQLAQFMLYFNGNLAREVGRLTGWRDKVWAGRYHAILISDEEIEATTAAERAKKGVQPLGTEKILAQDPETRPETLDRSPAPFVHTATRRIRQELRQAYGWFLAAYREAAERLRNGDRDARFPPGSFPPHLPFVPA